MSKPLKVHKGTPPSSGGDGRGSGRGEGQYEWIRQAAIESEPYIWCHVEFDANGDLEEAKKKAESHRSAISSGSNAYSMTEMRAAGWKCETRRRIRSDADPQIPAGECWLYWRKVRISE